MASRTADEVGPITSLMRFLFKNILMHLVITLGVLGNILTLIVLLQKKMKRTSQAQYLAALTLFDLIYIICSFVNNIEIIYPNLKLLEINPFLNLIFYPLGDFSSNSSVYVILMFTIERYIAIAYPLFSLEWCRPSRARKIICISIIFTFALTFPTVLENKIEFIWDEAYNATRPQLVETSIYPNFNLYKSIYFWIIAVMVQFIPLTLLIVLNGILMNHIHHSLKNKKSVSVKDKSVTNSKSSSVEQERLVYEANKSLGNDKSDNFNRMMASDNSNVNINYKQIDKPKIKFSNGKNVTQSFSSTTNIEIRANVSKNSSNHTDQNKATILLIATVVVFLVCQVPSALLLIYEAIFPLQNQTSKVVEDIILGLNNIANGLTAINASVNFILYSCFSEKFRQSFQSLFTRKRGKSSLNYQSAKKIINNADKSKP